MELGPEPGPNCTGTQTKRLGLLVAGFCGLASFDTGPSIMMKTRWSSVCRVLLRSRIYICVKALAFCFSGSVRVYYGHGIQFVLSLS